METAFYVLSVLQIALGLYLLLQGLQWLYYTRRRCATDAGFYAPRTAVLCSCKGLEPGLERNLTTLTEFDHQNYQVFFVLASESDPAHSIVKRVAAGSKPKAHVLIAGAPEGCGEKVNNLRFAIEQLPPDFEFLAFADSDGRPGKSWLKRLISPLADQRIGATTTMRWLIPNRSDLPSAFLAAWNAPVVTMLTEKGKNFCWGGGSAIRRSLFDQIGVIEDWKSSVSDDYSLTRALHHAGRSIMFLPDCLTVSYVEATFASLFEFANRQILITRVYSEQMWAFGFATHTLYCVTLLLGIGLTLGDLCRRRPRVSSRDAHVSSCAFGHDAQQRPRRRRHRSFVFVALSHHGASVDLYPADRDHPVSLRRELHQVLDHAQDALAHNHVRTDISERNTHSRELTTAYFPFGNIKVIELNLKYPVSAHIE